VICPTDGGRLEISNEAAECPMGHRWRQDAGIPRLVTEGPNYAASFGLQWNVYRQTQLDSYTRTTLSRDRARRCLGEECWERLHRPPRPNVLEVGCGAGRFTEVLLSTGARVTSVDLSSAVDANQINFPQNARHRILQADVRRLPFAARQYDVVFCLGVVQHTPNPEEAIRKLYEQVKPGGWLVFDHYTYTLSWFTKSAMLFRLFMRRLPPDKAFQWSRRLVKLFFPMHRAVRGHRVAQPLLSRVSPVLTYFGQLPLDDRLQLEWSLLDTHDSLTDRYKHFRTRGQIVRTLEALKSEAIWCDHGTNGVEARCRRHAAADRFESRVTVS
jgi:SAM-dependent methyltransferase